MSRAPRIAIDLEANVAGLVQDMRQATQAVTRFTAETKREVAQATQQVAQLGRAISLVGNFVRTSFAGLETTTLLSTLAGLSDRYQNLDSKLKLATRSQAEYRIAQEGTRKIATETYTSLESTVTLYQRVANSVQGLGVTQQQILKITETVNKAFLVSGATSEEAAASIVQLTQSFGSGFLRGQEFNSIAEQAPRLLRAIAETMHVPLGALKALANEGKITRDVLVQAFTGMASEKIATEAEKIPLTIGRAFTLLHNSALVFIGEASQQSGAARDLTTALKFVADNFATLATGVSFVIKTGIVLWFARLASAGREWAAVQLDSIKMTLAHAAAIEEDVRRTAQAAAAKATAALEAQRAMTLEAEATAVVIQLAREEAVVKLQAANADITRAEATIAAAKAAGQQSFALRELAAAETQLARAQAARSATLTEMATLGAQAARVASVGSLAVSPGRFSPADIAQMNAGVQALLNNSGKLGIVGAALQKLGAGLSAIVGGTTGIALIGVYALFKGFSALSDMIEESNKKSAEFKSSLEEVVKTAKYLHDNPGKGDANGWVESFLGSSVTVNQRMAQIRELESQIASLKEAARFNMAGDGGAQLGQLQTISAMSARLAEMKAEAAPAQAALANMGEELRSRLGPSFDEVREKARTMNEADFEKFKNSLSTATQDAIANLSELSQHLDHVVAKLPQTITDLQRQTRDVGLSAGQKAANHISDLVDDGLATGKGADYFKQLIALGPDYVKAQAAKEAADKRLAASKKELASSTREANKAERDAQAAAQMMEGYKARGDELKLELEAGQNITQSKKELIKFEHLLAVTKNESVKAHADEIRKILEENVATEDNLRAKQRAIEAEQRYAQVIRQVNDYLESRRLSSQREIEGIQHGGNTAEFNGRLNDIHDEFRNQRKQLDEQYRQDLNSIPLDDLKARNELEKSYQQQLGATFAAETLAVDQEKQLFAQKLAAQQNWKNGAVSAFEDYFASAQNVAGMTHDVFANAFKGMEDLVVQFVTTGKASFKDFVKAVLSDFVRMETRILMSKVFEYVFNMAMSYFGSGAGGGTSSGVGSSISDTGGQYNYGTGNNGSLNAYWRGGAFSAGNEIPFATGAAFTNGIYSRPTVAPMAKFGEGGKPEAIVPLARDSKGQLGIAAQGMGGGSVSNYTEINISVDQSGAASTQAKMDNNSSAARELAGLIEQQTRETMRKESMPGGLLWKMRHEYA